jgi:hypothetical protein
MNDIELQDGLRSYYGSIVPGDSVRATKLVGAAIVARRGRSTSGTWARPRVFVGVAAAVTVALVAGVGFAAWRTGPNGGLPGGPAGSPSASASAATSSMPGASPIDVATATPIANATETAAQSPSATRHAATSATPAGHFSATGSMDKAYDTATLLLDGRVLMTGESKRMAFGNYTVAVYTTAAELYDPATGKFTPTGSMIQPQGGATVTRLADGRVLFAGGAQFSSSGGQLVITRLATAELYDPTTGTFSTTGSMTHPRNDHTAALLPSGEVLIAGGDLNSSDEDRTAELYDPATGTFKPTGDMTKGRAMARAVALADGRVLILGYYTGPTVTSSADLYDPHAGTFSSAGSMTTARMSPAVTLLQDGRVLIASGQMPYEVAPAELFDPATGAFTPTGSFITERSITAGALLGDGRVLFAGGTWTAQIGRVQPELAGGSVAAVLSGGAAAPALVFADLGVAPVPTAGAGVPGATAPSTTLSSAELYDPSTGKFVMTGSMRTPRAGNTATVLVDGRVLITGGDTSGLTAELYQP